MSLQQDLETLTGDAVRAESICKSLFAKGTSRQQAYDRIVEVARQAGLEIVRLTALLVKYDEERRLQRAASGDACDLSEDAECVTRKFIKIVSTYGNQHQVRTRHDLTILLAELSLFGLKDLPTDSAALAYIEDQRRVTAEQLTEVDAPTARHFHRLKHHWLSQHIESRCSGTTHDDLVARATSIRQDFMNIFGKEFLAEREQYFRMEVAGRRLQLVKENPGINEIDIERMLGKGKGHSDSSLSRHQLGLPIGCFVSLQASVAPIGEGYTRARSLLRVLATLTHPDKVRQRGLGWNQRSQLESIWHEMAPLRSQSNNKSILAQSVIYLERKLQLAEQILELAHIEDLDATLVIQGSTVEEQIRWLEIANERLDAEIRTIQANNLQYSTNQQLTDMQALIEAPKEIQEFERQAMIEKCDAFRKHADKLEDEASRFIAACA